VSSRPRSSSMSSRSFVGCGSTRALALVRRALPNLAFRRVSSRLFAAQSDENREHEGLSHWQVNVTDVRL
jgi:hypothetical protein